MHGDLPIEVSFDSVCSFSFPQLRVKLTMVIGGTCAGAAITRNVSLARIIKYFKEVLSRCQSAKSTRSQQKPGALAN